MVAAEPLSGGREVQAFFSTCAAAPAEQVPVWYAMRTVANNTREDGEEFLNEAAALPVQTHVQVFPLERINEALQALKNDAIRGAAVVEMP